MSTKIQELPEVGEIVIGTISKIGDHGAYANLDEYDGIQGFLHISEIAPGWVRNVTRFVKKGDKKVLLVKRINKERSDVDLSLKQISKDQRKKKLQDVKRFEKEKGILKNIQEKADLTNKQLEKLEDQLLSKYNPVYDAVVDIATNNISVLEWFLTTINDLRKGLKWGFGFNLLASILFAISIILDCSVSVNEVLALLNAL